MPERDERGRIIAGTGPLNPIGRPKGAKGVAHAIMRMTGQGQELVDWCMLLWRDVDAPIEWRWKAFEWLSNRGLGTQPTTAILNLTGNVNNSRQLAALNTEDLERIDLVFKEAHSRKVIDVASTDE